MGDIVAEIEALAADGVVEITLLGQNVNSYGRDLDGRRPLFAELLRGCDAVEGIRRIRFTSPHPKDLRPETIAAMAESESVCEQLHLPVQAGSNRILAAMHRGYRVERYLERLAAARAAIPDLTVSTDIIVGFPGETEEDFQATLDLVEEARFDFTCTFICSPGRAPPLRTWTIRCPRTQSAALPAAHRPAGLDLVVAQPRPRRHGARTPRRGPLQEGRDTPVRSDPRRQAGSRPRRRIRRRRNVRRRHDRDRLAALPHRRHRGVSADPDAVLLAIAGPTAAGKSAVALEGSRLASPSAAARSRSCAATPCRSTAVSTSAPRSPAPKIAPPSRTTASTSSTPTKSSRPPTTSATPGRPSRRSTPAVPSRCWSAARVCTCGRSQTGSTSARRRSRAGRTRARGALPR